MIYDITNPYEPSHLLSYNTPENSILDFAIENDILAVSYLGEEGFLSPMIDLFDIFTLDLISTFSVLPGSYDEEESMLIINNNLYKSVDNGIQVFDISNPISPTLIDYYINIDDTNSYIWL